MHDFSGRRVLISGAAGGLGQPLCHHLLAAGASLIATDVSDAKGEELRAHLAPDFGGDCIRFITLDQSSPALVADTIAAEMRDNGPIDTLINNAAIYPSMPAEDLPHEVFAKVQAVNVGGAVGLAVACLPGMKAKGFGRIVNVASITFDTGYRDLSAYVASKGALIGLARVWAREFGPFGVTVNAISPGAFQTAAEAIHPNPEAYSQFVIDQQAVKRRGSPTDFASLVAFLISTEAGFITGQNIRVDGGWVTA